MSLKSLKELTVLSTLRAHPLHGYALVDALDGGLGWTVGLTRSTVYAVLKRFAERRWVEGKTERAGGYPEREVYHVTDDGERAHRELLETCISDLTEGTHTVAALLAHLDDLGTEDQRRAIELMLEDRRRRLEVLRTFPAHDGLAGRALALLARQVQAEVETLEVCLSAEPPRTEES